MKRIILHPGMPKTATTSIQYFLMTNAEALEKHGIGYYLPINTYTWWKEAANGAFLLSEAVSRIERTTPRKESTWMLETGIKRDPGLLARERKSFRNYVRDHDTIILSEEYLWKWRLYYTDFWPTVRAVLEEWAEEEIVVDVIAYVRRQDLWAFSMWKEHIQGRLRCTLDFDEAVEVMEAEGLLDYRGEVEDMAGAFGYDHVVIRAFDKERFVGGDIYHDIFAAAGLEWPEDVQLPKKDRHSGISTDVADALLSLNRRHYFRPERRFRYLCGIIAQMSERLRQKKKDTDLYPLETSARRAIIARCEEGNRWIYDNFCDGEPLFDTVVDENDVWRRKPLRKALIMAEMLSVFSVNYTGSFFRRAVRKLRRIRRKN